MVKTDNECKIYAGNKEIMITDCNLNVVDMSRLKEEIKKFDPENANVILESIKNTKIDIYGNAIYFGYDKMLKFEVNNLKRVDIRGDAIFEFISGNIPNNVAIYSISFIGKGNVEVLLSTNIRGVNFPIEIIIPYSRADIISEATNIIKEAMQRIMENGYVPMEVSFSKDGYSIKIGFVVYDERGVTTLTVGLINGKPYSENSSFIGVAERVKSRIIKEVEGAQKEFKRLLG